jgi:hypothetical protein
VIWEPFVLALVLGLIVSAGLYAAYLWPVIEPVADEPAEAPSGELFDDEPAPADAAAPRTTDGTESPTESPAP